MTQALKSSWMLCTTYLLPPAPTRRETTKPKVTAPRSLPDIRSASFRVLPLTFRSERLISRPANNPTKHQVVLIGILEAILKTKSTMAKSRSTRVASGISLTRDFSSTTYWILSPPCHSIRPRPAVMKRQMKASSIPLRDLGRKTAMFDISYWSQVDQRMPVVIHCT